MTRRRPLASLGPNEAGAALVEFALIAPILIGFLLGLFDLGSNLFTATQLEGAIQKAARSSTIEGAAGNEAAIDAAVVEAVRAIAPGATVTFNRKSYSSFEAVSRPEDFTDIDGDGTCGAGEPFEDANGNGQWDIDRGMAGFGGARDATKYTVTVAYERLFPVARFIGLPPTHEIRAVTVLRNQPYGSQRTPVIGNCP
jgi:Flp pilus assembly protein TadG